MTKFEGVYLTQLGYDFIAQSGFTNLVFSKAETGSGKYLSKNEVKDLTALKNSKQTFTLTSSERTSPDIAKVRFDISNTGLLESYTMTEIGLFALDDNQEEFLYCVAFAFEGNGELVPADTSSYKFFMRMSIETKISTDATVSIVINDRHVDSTFDLDSAYALENRVITKALLNLINTEIYNASFKKIFGGDDPEPRPDPEVINDDDLDDIIATEWDGEETTRADGLKTNDMIQCMTIPWSGESTSREDGLQAWEVSSIINS